MAKLKGQRLAVVEDDGLLAMVLQDTLELAGAEVVHLAYSLDGALAAAASDHVDCAVLDVNLRGENCFPAAEAFLKRGVPVVLASGEEPRSMPASLGDVPFLRKPYSYQALVEAVADVIAERPD